MNLLDGIMGLLFYSFYRLWYPVVATIGLSNPVTLTFVAIYNTFSFGYLLFITAVGYLVWRRKGWMLSFAVSLVWTLVGLLFFWACWQCYGLTTAFAAIFTHGWLELFALFYWVHSLRRACLNCYFSFEDEWSSWTDLFTCIWKPTKFFSIVNVEVKKAWNLITKVLNLLWTRKLEKDFLFVLFLIFVSALIETYITPTVALQSSQYF